jgi:hypothetical protein
MFLLQKSKTKASARAQIAIRDVKDGVLVLPGNRYRAILQVSSVNFELKSEDEQDALIDTYESFLNSVDCPLQILIRTREIDMDKYLAELNERLMSEVEAVYRNQLANYNDFIRKLVSANKILTRFFYVVVPHGTNTSADFDMAKVQLDVRVDIVSKGLARLGMQSRPLSSLEVLDVFYSFYSPKQAKTQPLTEQVLRVLQAGYIQKGELTL